MLLIFSFKNLFIYNNINIIFFLFIIIINIFCFIVCVCFCINLNKFIFGLIICCFYFIYKLFCMLIKLINLNKIKCILGQFFFVLLIVFRRKNERRR